MQARFLSLPKFKHFRFKPVPSPVFWFGNHESADETKQVIKSLQGNAGEIYEHEVGEEE